MSDLRAQMQRDLQWLWDCPDLMMSGPATESATGTTLPLPTIPSLDDPLWETVEAHLSQGVSHRVGHYVETLIEVWLGTIPGITEIRRGIQIQDGKITRGELDFLFQKDGRLHHLEVALKFFLYHPHAPGGSQDYLSEFPGPNARDNFEKKRDKILYLQLPLGRSRFPEVSKSRALMKGMIFYHPQQAIPSNLPEKMNPNHARGMWIRSTEWELLHQRFPNCSGSILKKPFWLAEKTPFSPLPELTAVLQQHFGGSDSPVLLSLRAANGIHETESIRLFVVSAAWPDSLHPAHLAHSSGSESGCKSSQEQRASK